MDRQLNFSLETLSRQFIQSLQFEKSYLNETKEFNSNEYLDYSNLIEGLIQKPYKTTETKKYVSYSGLKDPLDTTPGRISGYSRNWGHASFATQSQVIEKILHYSKDLTKEDQAILLGIARIESGFNPDAATPSTSASGVFQIVDSTRENLRVAKKNKFDADENIKGGIKLYKENLARVNRDYPHLTGDERAKMLYALHHDGPSLKHGGAKIAEEQLIPYLAKFRQFTESI
jgi:putative chitinase